MICEELIWDGGAVYGASNVAWVIRRAGFSAGVV